MEQCEQWDAYLNGAFAGVTLRFAEHSQEVDYAQKALIAAIKSGISFKSFVEGVKSAQEKLFKERTVDEGEKQRLQELLENEVGLVETYFTT